MKDKRRRQEYDEMLRRQAGLNLYSQDIPAEPSDPNVRMYQALKPLSAIQKEFAAFVKDQIGAAFAKENGYSSHLAIDPKTGQQVLYLCFPDKQTADHFIQLMLAKEMIKPFANIAAEKPSAAVPEEEKRKFPSPFNTGIPRLTPSGAN